MLEPLQAGPVIIEDNCFIGARSEVAEGVVVEEGAVISMGVFIGASTKIVDRATGEVIYGRVPAYSVVVPGHAAGQGRRPRPRLRGDRQDGRRAGRGRRPGSTNCCGTEGDAHGPAFHPGARRGHAGLGAGAADRSSLRAMPPDVLTRRLLGEFATVAFPLPPEQQTRGPDDEGLIWFRF